MINLKNNLKQLENLKEIANKNNKVITISEIATVFPNCGEEMMMEICDYLDAVCIEVVDSTKLINTNSIDEPTDEELAKEEANSIIYYEEASKASNSLRMYFQEIGQYPLLSKKEETDLAIEIQSGIRAQEELDKFGDFLDNEYIDLLKKRIKNCEYATRELTEGNLRLVVYIAKMYRGRGLDLVDLIAEGNKGLIHACKKFDFRFGNKFSTYATYWIKQNILRAIQTIGRVIRIPVHVSEDLRKYYTSVNNLKKTLNREPSVEEIAVDMNYTIVKVLELIDSSSKIDTLDRTVGDDEDTSVVDLVKDDKTLSPLDKLICDEKTKVLYDAIDALPERQAFIVRKYNGFDDDLYTLEEIGEMLGISRERVRQLLAKASETLKANPLINEYYNPDYKSSLHD